MYTAMIYFNMFNLQQDILENSHNLVQLINKFKKRLKKHNIKNRAVVKLTFLVWAKMVKGCKVLMSVHLQFA